ncbi:MAG: ERF family protein [Oscillospiraceae bacterium]|nr:ERF family protein [Oscillospiraceae bacterium]
MSETKKTAAADPAGKVVDIKDAGKARKELTLEQKFVELRKAVPAIIQKQHSDGVKYKFAKIFDVYQLLAPAMNTFGVNFDVVGEEATRHYDNGDPKYFDSYQQQTRSGPRTVWIYEADLTIRWTNADDPKDQQEITLHALGTNDGGPDKAKGSAWTYCLKYYLFEKFNIDQGEDDPDNYDHGDEPGAPQGGQNRPQSGGNAAGGGNGRPQTGNGQSGSQKAGGGKLSDAQINRLHKKAEAAGMTKEQCNARIREKYGKDNPHDLTRQQYDEICAALDAAKKEDTTNA